MTWSESPRIMRFDQFWSCCVELGLVRALGDAVEVGEEVGRELARRRAGCSFVWRSRSSISALGWTFSWM